MCMLPMRPNESKYYFRPSSFGLEQRGVLQHKTLLGWLDAPTLSVKYFVCAYRVIWPLFQPP